jgi:tetratricopeptide (TPR) repeat protein
MAAWRAKPRPTGPIPLAGDQWRVIPELLGHGAEAYGLRGECWTYARVATVIGEEYGSWYHTAHVPRLLKRLHGTPLCCRDLARLRSGLDLAIRRLRCNPPSLLRVLPEPGYPSKIKSCMQRSVEQAIATNRAFAKAYRALGSLYEQKKDYQQDRTIYERGLQYAPDDPVLLNNLSWVHLMSGGDVATAYVYIKAASLAPEDPDLQPTFESQVQSPIMFASRGAPWRCDPPVLVDPYND